MTGNQVMELEDFGAMATAFRNDDVNTLMEMTGQGSVQEKLRQRERDECYSKSTERWRS